MAKGTCSSPVSALRIFLLENECPYLKRFKPDMFWNLYFWIQDAHLAATNSCEFFFCEDGGPGFLVLLAALADCQGLGSIKDRNLPPKFRDSELRSRHLQGWLLLGGHTGSVPGLSPAIGDFWQSSVSVGLWMQCTTGSLPFSSHGVFLSLCPASLGSHYNHDHLCNNPV